jgi:hypothetical protein
MSSSGRRSARFGLADADIARVRLVGVLVPRRRDRRAGGDEVFPFRCLRVVEGRRVGLPGLDALRRSRLVGHVGGVVLVGEAREVMAELVDEDVGRPEAVGRDG